VTLRRGLVALVARHQAQDCGNRQERRQGGHRAAGDAAEAAVLAYVLADELVLGPAVQGGGDVRDRIGEAWVVEGQVVGRASEAQIGEARLLGEGAAKRRRQRAAVARVEVADPSVPG